MYMYKYIYIVYIWTAGAQGTLDWVRGHRVTRQQHASPAGERRMSLTCAATCSSGIRRETRLVKRRTCLLPRTVILHALSAGVCIHGRPHTTLTHTYAPHTLAPQSPTHPRGTPCTPTRPWRSGSADCTRPCTLTQTYTSIQNNSKTRN
jgi:hypothetical protein